MTLIKLTRRDKKGPVYINPDNIVCVYLTISQTVAVATSATKSDGSSLTYFVEESESTVIRAINKGLS